MKKLILIVALIGCMNGVNAHNVKWPVTEDEIILTPRHNFKIKLFPDGATDFNVNVKEFESELFHPVNCTYEGEANLPVFIYPEGRIVYNDSGLPVVQERTTVGNPDNPKVLWNGQVLVHDGAIRDSTNGNMIRPPGSAPQYYPCALVRIDSAPGIRYYKSRDGNYITTDNAEEWYKNDLQLSAGDACVAVTGS